MEKYICNEQHGHFRTSQVVIYINTSYIGFYHNVKILKDLNVYRNWHQYFNHGDEYFEYLLGDPNYIGEKMFIMHKIGWKTLVLNANHVIMRTYNKMYASFRLPIKWSVGKLKRKWRHHLKNFDSTKWKYSNMFWTAILMTNFLHMKCMDLTYEVIGDQNVDPTAHNWTKDI